LRCVTGDDVRGRLAPQNPAVGTRDVALASARVEQVNTTGSLALANRLEDYKLRVLEQIEKKLPPEKLVDTLVGLLNAEYPSKYGGLRPDNRTRLRAFKELNTLLSVMTPQIRATKVVMQEGEKTEVPVPVPQLDASELSATLDRLKSTAKVAEKLARESGRFGDDEEGDEDE